MTPAAQTSEPRTEAGRLTITRADLVRAVENAAASAIGVSYENHASWIWEELRSGSPRRRPTVKGKAQW